MLRGLYTATAGMMSQQRRMETLSNNMANANTPGYKADQTSLRAFPELLLHATGKTEVPTQKPLNLPFAQPIGGLNTGVYVQELAPLFAQGDIQQTGIDTDLSIIQQQTPGAVFFTVEQTDGTYRYTRNGNFALDSQGFLTTNDGLYVLDENFNRIQINERSFQVQPVGTLLVNEQPVARLGLTYAENPSLLQKEGNGLFRLEQDGQPQQLPLANNVNFEIRQGYLERSNVDSSRTMTEMMAAFRAFEANQKVIQAYDQSMQKAANEIGRIN
ncbi:flagellar hook-basal body protein [Sutcliffiella cohnii]